MTILEDVVVGESWAGRGVEIEVEGSRRWAQKGD